MTRVLVVDDDPALLRALRIGLEARAFDVTVAHTGAEGLSRAAQGMPDLIVLDLGLPDIDGVEVCKRLRQWTEVPVIVLSALDSEDRKVLALDSGADDYITKPFGMQELEARLRVALRHAAGRDREAPQATMTVGPIRVDIASRVVEVEGTPIELTAREFDLLAFLARNAGWDRLHGSIEQVDAIIGDRPADRDRADLPRHALGVRGDHRRLGRAVGVQHPAGNATGVPLSLTL